MNIYLCSGLSSDYEDTISIDVLREVKPTIQADVRYLPLRPKLKPKNLLMTPPCTHFTIARPFPRPGIRQAIEVVAACFDAICYLEPQYWILENPCGHLAKIIGHPKYGLRYRAADLKGKRTAIWTNKSLRRSMIPGKITKELLS